MLSARLHQPIKPSVTWKEDWFSWKPNVCWSFNFMRQYSANATPFSLNCYRTIINRRKRVFTNQLELTWQKERTCWSRISQLHFTMYTSNIDITKRKVSPSWRRLTRDKQPQINLKFIFSLTSFKDANLPLLRRKFSNFSAALYKFIFSWFSPHRRQP